MSTNRAHNNKTSFYFFTLTCCNWISLFELTSLYDNIYKWFDILKKRNVLVNAFVIMPNHLHALVYANETEKRINDIIGTGKRFMTYEIVKRLRLQNDFSTLQKLSDAVPGFERIKGKLHQAFEPSPDIKEIVTEKFMVQKINYIHMNPVRGKWKLVEDYRAYKHSSAGFYEPIESAPYSGYNVIHYAGIEEAVEN
jgi:REP element-mobilizing transposase RayT